ncbi:hypothetical protein DPEC_G00021000 [Dallia pectoralis]|uniref:Uncharacterized protein n=1 Tax=Dallia pectoralis TaxID=75939 RepID=A0ACC2HG45_DALPE|nr:hypothetical protein DPEC_G00021000 [Dallia pectoralis]
MMWTKKIRSLQQRMNSSYFKVVFCEDETTRRADLWQSFLPISLSFSCFYYKLQHILSSSMPLHQHPCPLWVTNLEDMEDIGSPQTRHLRTSSD